jgi:SAM-dependent methyltransferase
MPDSADTATDPYQSIVAFYDLEHDEFDEDIDTLIEIADSIPEPVLELGSGTGRVLQGLVENEVAVTGIDRSRPMLEAARRRLGTLPNHKLATLVEGEMTSVHTLGLAEFGLAAYTLNALMHLSTPEDQSRSLASVRQVLVPKGFVYIDVMNPHPEQLVHLGSGVILEGSWTMEDGRTVDKWSHRSIHPAEQLIVTDIWYDVIGEGGDLQRFRTSFDHRYLHANELRLMLRHAGYDEIGFYGDYLLGAYEDESDRLIALARNPGP